ncbi:hypothetical protein [Streptomyces sp. NPDC001719]
MFGRKNSTEAEGASFPERVSRGLQYTGQRVGGERGGRVANRVSEAIGCGRIEFCDDANCPHCAPAR